MNDVDTPPRWYHTPDVVRLTGATPRQVDYWCRLGLITPENEGRGSGSQRCFTRDDVALVKAFVVLRQFGLNSDAARNVLAQLGHAIAHGLHENPGASIAFDVDGYPAKDTEPRIVIPLSVLTVPAEVGA